MRILNKMKKTAILLGATGLTGSHLLDLLLNSNDYLKLEEQADKFTADEVFVCIGTTKAKTPDKKLYHAIDYGIPTISAKLAEQNKINTFSVISAIGANAKSSVFYSRTKGEMEQAILQCNIPNILVYRPSIIYGNREDKRWAEKIGAFLFKGLQFLLVGKFKKYRAISGEDLAKVLYFGMQQKKGHQIIFLDKFKER